MDRLSLTLFVVSLSLASACGGGSTTGPSSGPNPKPTPTPGDVSIVQGAERLTTTAFDPNPKQLSLGGAATVAVRWVNGDGETHEIASDNQAFATSSLLASGATYSVTLAAGTYHYHCAIHPNMVGTIAVGP